MHKSLKLTLPSEQPFLFDLVAYLALLPSPLFLYQQLLRSPLRIEGSRHSLGWASVGGCGTGQRGLECFSLGGRLSGWGKLGSEPESWTLGWEELLSSCLIIIVII